MFRILPTRPAAPRFGTPRHLAPRQCLARFAAPYSGGPRELLRKGAVGCAAWGTLVTRPPASGALCAHGFAYRARRGLPGRVGLRGFAAPKMAAAGVVCVRFFWHCSGDTSPTGGKPLRKARSRAFLNRGCGEGCPFPWMPPSGRGWPGGGPLPMPGLCLGAGVRGGGRWPTDPARSAPWLRPGIGPASIRKAYLTCG